MSMVSTSYSSPRSEPVIQFLQPLVFWSIWLQSAWQQSTRWNIRPKVSSKVCISLSVFFYGQWSQRLNNIKPFLQNDHFSPSWARWRITKYELGTRHQGSHGHYTETTCSYSLLHMFFLLMPSSILFRASMIWKTGMLWKGHHRNRRARTMRIIVSQTYQRCKEEAVTRVEPFFLQFVSGEEVESNVVHLVSSEHNSTLGGLTNRYFNRSETDHRCFMISSWCFISRTCERDARTVQYNSDGNKARLMRVILAGEDEFLGWPAWIVSTNCDISGTCRLGVRQEKNPDALVEGISLLQNAQNLIGTQNRLRRRDGYERRMPRSSMKAAKQRHAKPPVVWRRIPPSDLRDFWWYFDVLSAVPVRCWGDWWEQCQEPCGAAGAVPCGSQGQGAAKKQRNKETNLLNRTWELGSVKLGRKSWKPSVER